MTTGHSTTEIVETEGHLIDSRLMTEIFDSVVKHGGTFEVLDFTIGRTNNDFSRLQMRVAAPDRQAMQGLLEELLTFGCRTSVESDAALQPAPSDGCAPDDFYSTSNHRTSVRHRGQWLEVERQRMDAAIVIENGRATCRKLRDLRVGDPVVCFLDGIRVTPEFRERDRHGFAFMTGGISSERHVETSVERIADMIRDVKNGGGRIAFVVGPVVVHTGAAAYFCDLIRRGYVDVLLAGNALAVHDIEGALYGTSLGISLKTGVPVEGGHRHHMRAINAIRRAGGIGPAVASGLLTSGIMFESVKHNVPYVLAGSIRDDGPLPDTIMDLVEAQDRYAEALANVGIAVILSTMLHGIGVGNMLPSWIKVVCVDINPSVVTKLVDRGSAQTMGVVTDTGLFVHQLARSLK
ncbi:MAG TPA: TIGR00300 family protein [Vicinamibacterales bacterium]|nr:TIGR00300 family protein [Vicinamibacterales bacterium]